MEQLTVLDRAADGFAQTLSDVQVAQWGDPSPNDGQSVRELVAHVIGGNLMAAAILRGGSREDGIAQFTHRYEDTDLAQAFADSRREQAEAFAAPGALDRVVAHPAGDLPATMLLGFRITEYALHGWDLARSIGVDDAIDPEVLAALWEILLPMEGLMAASGMFGGGRSGQVPDDAPLQTRVLDLAGRRA